MRLHLTAERPITACSSGQLWCSEHWIGMQDSIFCNGWDCRLALLWMLLVLSETAFSKHELSSRFILEAVLGLDIGGNQISSVYDLARTSGIQDIRWARACWSLIEPLSWVWHSYSISSSSLDGNWFIIYIEIQVLGGPNIQVSENVVKSALEVLWIWAYWRKCGLQVSGICRLSAESLSGGCLWGSLSQAAAWLWSLNNRSYSRILEMQGPNILLSQNPVECCYLSPRAVHIRWTCGGHHSPKNRLSLSVTVIAFKRQPSHTNQAYM